MMSTRWRAVSSALRRPGPLAAYRIWLSLILFSLSSCSLFQRGPTPTPVPSFDLERLNLVYSWSAGSLPPPYYSQYEIRLDPDGKVELIFLPDYDFNQPPRWVEQAQASPEQLAEIKALLAQPGIFSQNWEFVATDEPPGSTVESLALSDGQRTITIHGALSEEDAHLVEPLLAAVHALISEATWDKLKVQQDQYISEHQE